MAYSYKSLNELANVVNGHSFKSGDFSEGNEVKSIKITNVGVRTFVETQDNLLPSKFSDDYSKYLVNEGDIVVALTRTIISNGLKVAVIPKAYDKSLLNQRVASIQVKKEILSRQFLYYYLSTIEAYNFVKNSVNELMQPNLSINDLKNFKIPVPSLETQKQIVAKLDQAFADIEKAKVNAEQNLVSAKELFDSYLQKVFSQKGDGWDIKTVGEMATSSLGKMLDKKKNKGDMKPYLRNLSVRWFSFNLVDVLEMRFEPHEVEKYSVQKGDLLICEGGYPGRAAIWEKDQSMYFQKAIHRVRFHDLTYNKWLLYFLFYSDSKGTLKEHFTGAGIQHFTGKALKNLPLVFPPSEETAQYTQKFDKLLSEVEKLKNIYIGKLAKLDELKQSILQKAFNGELA